MSYLARMKTKAEGLLAQDKVRILAIESSCDETAAAVVENGRRILSNQVYSQIPMHIPYGGVVPEIASRSHIEKLDAVTQRALEEAGLALEEMDAIAVTQGPGLVGALLTGLSYAKGLAFGLDKPLLATNHIFGHICANYLAYPDLNPPFLCLVVSGGHSHLIEVEEEGFKLLGCTQDDAAGEAFDKAARVLGLPYPGGPHLDDLAEQGDPLAFQLPLPHPAGAYDFSFSGLKTAFINLVHRLNQKGEEFSPADLAASFRHRVVEHLCERTMKACGELGWDTLALAGGVSANRLLRRELSAKCEAAGVRLLMPPLSLCGDNAAMIGAAAYAQLLRSGVSGLEVNAAPALRLFSEERVKR